MGLLYVLLGLVTTLSALPWFAVPWILLDIWMGEWSLWMAWSLLIVVFGGLYTISYILGLFHTVRLLRAGQNLTWKAFLPALHIGAFLLAWMILDMIPR